MIIIFYIAKKWQSKDRRFPILKFFFSVHLTFFFYYLIFSWRSCERGSGRFHGTSWRCPTRLSAADDSDHLSKATSTNEVNLSLATFKLFQVCVFEIRDRVPASNGLDNIIEHKKVVQLSLPSFTIRNTKNYLYLILKLKLIVLLLLLIDFRTCLQG